VQSAPSGNPEQVRLIGWLNPFSVSDFSVTVAYRRNHFANRKRETCVLPPRDYLGQQEMFRFLLLPLESVIKGAPHGPN
jgi:hypothetical protein